MTLAKDCSFKSFALSDKGLIRQKNEDSYGINEENHFFALADGLGGRNAGEIASNEAIQRMLAFVGKTKSFKDCSLNENDVKELFLNGIKNVNKDIFNLSHQNSSLEGMGTTLTTLFFFHDKLFFTNIGDSRLYKLKNHQLTKLTKDDTLLEELLNFGLIDDNEAKIFPLKHVITKSIGSFESVEPSWGIENFSKDEIYLLCSDGLYGLVSHEKISSILDSDFELNQKGQMLLKEALSAGGVDNITLIIVEIKK